MKLFLSLSIVLFCSFTTPTGTLNLSQTSLSKDAKFRKVVFGYEYTYGNCRYTVTVVMETTTGQGVGMTTQTCRGGKPRTIYYNINGGFYARIDASRLSDFKEEDGTSYNPSQEEIDGIVDGYNENVPEE